MAFFIWTSSFLHIVILQQIFHCGLTILSCNVPMVKCPTGEQCISFSQVCDEKIDCPCNGNCTTDSEETILCTKGTQVVSYPNAKINERYLLPTQIVLSPEHALKLDPSVYCNYYCIALKRDGKMCVAYDVIEQHGAWSCRFSTTATTQELMFNPSIQHKAYHFEDVDECAKSTVYTRGCGKCHNIYGSYTCTCSEDSGYTGGSNGFNCSDINECETKPALCPAPHRCENVFGSFSCICAGNVTSNSNGIRCRDSTVITNHTMCTAVNVICHQHSWCLLTSGQPTCVCKAGYAGNGRTCSPRNVCANNPCSILDNSTTVYSCKQSDYGEFVCIPITVAANDLDGSDTWLIIVSLLILLLVAILLAAMVCKRPECLSETSEDSETWEHAGYKLQMESEEYEEDDQEPGYTELSESYK